MKINDIENMFKEIGILSIKDKWNFVRKHNPEIYELLDDITINHYDWLSDKPLQVLYRMVYGASLIRHKDKE